VPDHGSLTAGRVDVGEALLDRWAAPPERATWWADRVANCHSVLAAAPQEGGMP